VSAVGLVTVLAAGVLAVAWPLAWIAAHVWDRLLIRAPAAQALRRARWSLVVLAAPLALGGVVVLAAAGAFEHGVACHCGPGVGVHLCLVHPGQAAALVPWALLLLALGVPRGARRGLGLIRGWGLSRRLVRLAARAHADRGMRLAALGRPNAFTVGLRRPLAVVDADWWGGLTAGERLMVAAHEQAHVQRRDPLGLAWARLAAGLLPPASDRVVGWWRASAEHLADRAAAEAVGDPLEVAAFLLRQQTRGRSAECLAFHDGAMARRIEALATLDLGAAPAPGGVRDGALAGMLVLSGLGVLAGASLHGLAERLLAFFH
jgi:Zn-dependent protease with chaperone function